jgi:hypothetical protein
MSIQRSVRHPLLGDGFTVWEEDGQSQVQFEFSGRVIVPTSSLMRGLTADEANAEATKKMRATRNRP